jgi:hypothetical protein
MKTLWWESFYILFAGYGKYNIAFLKLRYLPRAKRINALRFNNGF